jgi:hypothetical protein
VSVALYRYTGDDGLNYQLLLPSELATAFSYATADSGDPYLPSFIHPRFATYLDVSSGLVVQAIITTPYSSTVPPPTVTIATVDYALRGVIGEVRGSRAPDHQLIAGPQGPPGEPGPASGQVYRLSSNFNFGNADYTNPADFNLLFATPGFYVFEGNIWTKDTSSASQPHVSVRMIGDAGLTLTYSSYAGYSSQPFVSYSDLTNPADLSIWVDSNFRPFTIVGIAEATEVNQNASLQVRLYSGSDGVGTWRAGSFLIVTPAN